MKIRIVIWGVGNTASILQRYLNYEVVEVIAYVDNDIDREDLCNNSVPLLRPDQLCNILLDIDYILIASKDYQNIYRQIKGMGIESDKVKQVFDINLYRTDEVIKKITTHNFCSYNHNYKIGDYIIDLGDSSNLPLYQREFSLYDKFLPRLANLFKGDENWLIDVGANVGDTVASLRTNSDCSILAIEPADEYYNLLEKNVRHINYKDNIEIVKCFITNDENKKYVAKFHGGSANMEEVSRNFIDVKTPSVSLEKLVESYNINWKKILLIKTDTDGFDYKCILSCNEQLKNTDAFIFFENYIMNRNNLHEYNNMYDYLEKMEYEIYYIFDNYGNFLTKGDKNTLRSINEYLIRGKENISKLTFEYTDILACKRKNIYHIEKLIDNYYLS